MPPHMHFILNSQRYIYCAYTIFRLDDCKLMFSRGSAILRICCQRAQTPIRARPTRPTFALLSRYSSTMWLPSPLQLHSPRTPPAITAQCHIFSCPAQQTPHLAWSVPPRVSALRTPSRSPVLHKYSLGSRQLSTLSASAQELASPLSGLDSVAGGMCCIRIPVLPLNCPKVRKAGHEHTESLLGYCECFPECTRLRDSSCWRRIRVWSRGQRHHLCCSDRCAHTMDRCDHPFNHHCVVEPRFKCVTCRHAGEQGGSVAILRLSGSGALAITSRIFREGRMGKAGAKQWHPETHRIYYGHVVDNQGDLVDEVCI